MCERKRKRKRKKYVKEYDSNNELKEVFNSQKTKNKNMTNTIKPEDSLKDISTMYNVFSLKEALEETKIKYAILKDRKEYYLRDGDEKDFVSDESIQKFDEYISLIKKEIETKENTTVNPMVAQNYLPAHRGAYHEHNEYQDFYD